MKIKLSRTNIILLLLCSVIVAGGGWLLFSGGKKVASAPIANEGPITKTVVSGPGLIEPGLGRRENWLGVSRKTP